MIHVSADNQDFVGEDRICAADHSQDIFAFLCCRQIKPTGHRHSAFKREGLRFFRQVAERVIDVFMTSAEEIASHFFRDVENGHMRPITFCADGDAAHGPIAPVQHQQAGSPFLFRRAHLVKPFVGKRPLPAILRQAALNQNDLSLYIHACIIVPAHGGFTDAVTDENHLG
ncbi:MAG: hypothetical protein BWY83_02674 [bacterium ADurb.Bin478]|nr:MAG: hypothetical protein BWY83_02674 [bacterium ADurb.Bin478]